MKPKDYNKLALSKALKEAGLTYTFPNFIARYEKKICEEHGKPFLVSRRDEKNRRVYTQEEIDAIVKTAKEGWFKRHWHWPPING